MTNPRMAALRVVWANPVVIRDLRVRMRGSKSYWQQALYLALLGTLALVGYNTAVGSSDMPGGMSAVDVQQRLQAFYYFIFFTLATLICLIAPALTAVSITTERQRLSLDLLLASPLSAAELLVGKMVSSTAFLALLLALSLPASALCVILGGATLADVVQVYVMMAVDGLVLAAIGLAVSCTVRAGVAALVWTYILTAAFLIVTAVLGTAVMSGPGPSVSKLLMIPGVLNPFVAVFAMSQSAGAAHWPVPLWVCGSILAALFVRLLVTAGTVRLGGYGGSPVASLRRQLLVATALMTALLASAIMTSAAGVVGTYGSASLTATQSRDTFIGGLFVLFLSSAFLFPSLFTPAMRSEDDPPGTVITERFAPRLMFRPEHGGALPFFCLWLIVLIAAALTGAGAVGAPVGSLLPAAALLVFCLSGIGFLFWSLARRTGSWMRGVTGARALSLVLFAAIAWLPIAVLGLAYFGQDEMLQHSPFMWLWILNPLAQMSGDGTQPAREFHALFWSGVVSCVLGIAAYPFWRPVVPGGLPKGGGDRDANAYRP